MKQDVALLLSGIVKAMQGRAYTPIRSRCHGHRCEGHRCEAIDVMAHHGWPRDSFAHRR